MDSKSFVVSLLRCYSSWFPLHWMNNGASSEAVQQGSLCLGFPCKMAFMQLAMQEKR